MKFNSSPALDGYVLMADYDHTATLILFPFRKDVWSDVEKAQKMHIDFIKKTKKDI